VTFHRPFDRSSIASIAHSNASPNTYSIAYHRSFHRRCSIPPHPRALERAAPLRLRWRSQSLDALWRRVARGTGQSTSTGSDGKIKRTGVRKFCDMSVVAKILSAHWFLQVGAAPFWPREGCAGAALQISRLISIFRAMALAMRVDEGAAASSPSCALMRFDAIDVRQVL